MNDSDTTGVDFRIDAADGSGTFQADIGNNVANSFLGFGIDGTEQMRLTASGYLGIGTTTPGSVLTVAAGSSWGQINMVNTSANGEVAIGFRSADDTLGGSGHWMLGKNLGGLSGDELSFYNGVGGNKMTLTTAGNLGIGTTSPWGGAGLRDQFTVAGRIYSTWNYLACDMGGSNAGVTTPGTYIATAASTAQGCGDFGINSNSTRGGYTVTSGYPTSLNLQADRSGQTPTNNDVTSLRTPALSVVATSSPTMEARIRTPNASSTNGAATTTLYLVGFGDHVSSVAAGGYVPNNFIGFAASSTANWKAIVVRAGTGTTTVDLGSAVSTSTTKTEFRRFRVEVSSSTVHFLVNGAVVATISPSSQVNVPLAPLVSVGKTFAAAAGVSQIDVNYLRVWVDDPADSSSGDDLLPGLTQVIPTLENDSFGANSGYGAWYYSSSSVPTDGDIVSFATGTASGVVVAARKGDSVVGVVSSYGNMTGNTTGNIPVLTSGRVDVRVSLSGGAIAVGDAIAVASSTPGVGIRSTRSGYIVGHAVEAFDPANGLGVCISGATSTDCIGLVTIQLQQGWSEGSVSLFADMVNTATDISQAVTDLADEVFAKGAEFTKLAVGKVVAQTVVVRDFFAQVFTILPGGSINLPAGTNQIAGSDILPNGATTYFVSNTNVTAGAKIFITPRTMLATPIAVTEVRTGEGFTVTLSGAAASDIPFDWFMLSTYDAGGAAPAAPEANTASVGVSGGEGAPLVVEESTPPAETLDPAPSTETPLDEPVSGGEAPVVPSESVSIPTETTPLP
jgi:hypothetical protein